MSYDFREILRDEVQSFLGENGLEDLVSEAEIVKKVLEGALYYEVKAKDKRLIFFRFYSPVTMREEVFVGSVLLNSFLSKNVIKACRQKDFGEIALVANDIENFYYLWLTDKTMEELKNEFIDTLEDNLENLYFDSDNEEEGIYGDFDKLFEFHKNERESFPIYPIPESFTNKLGKIARNNLLKMIKEFNFSSNPTTITANMAYFLSKDGNEFQSPRSLLAKIVSSYKDYLYVNIDDLKNALNLEKNYHIEDDKGFKELTEDMKKSMEKLTFSPDKLKTFLEKVVIRYDILAKREPEEWNMKYARDKTLKLTPGETVNEILSQAQLGYFVLNNTKDEEINTYCRCCGANPAQLMEKYILMGEDVGKFHNQIVNKDVKAIIKICVKCAVQSFLMTKLTGNIAGSLAFVPQQGNIIFHYGRHDKQEVQYLASKIEGILEKVKGRREIYRDLYENIRELRKIRDKQKTASAKKAQELEAEAERTTKDLEICRQNVIEIESILQSELGEGIKIDEEPMMDFLYSTQQDDIENYVFGIGLGNYRLMTFMLPQLKMRVDKKPHNYIQERFNDSRIAVLVLLSFLRKLCGCDGPYYFMTLPSLSEENFSTDTFYVKDEVFSAEEVKEYYEFFAGFSQKVVKRDEPSKQLIKKILISEKMVDDPLLTLSEVMRNSKVFSREGGDKYSVIKFDNNKTDLMQYFDAYLKARKYQKAKWGR